MAVAHELEGWDEDSSAFFLERGKVFTPGRDEMARVFVDLVPASTDETFMAVDIGVGGGWLSAAVLAHFPASRVMALDGSQVMLDHARGELAAFADRVHVATFRLEDDGWLIEVGGDVRCFMSSLVIHHLDSPDQFDAPLRRLATAAGSTAGIGECAKSAVFRVTMSASPTDCAHAI